MSKNFTITSILCLFFSLSSFGQLAVKKGEMIVQFQKNLDVPSLFHSETSILGSKVRHLKCLLPELNIHCIAFEDDKTAPNDILKALRSDSKVIYAQFNHKVYPRNTEPNDPLYEDQWALEQIQAIDVWDFGTGGYTADGKEIVVAVLDGGFDIDHQDLQQSFWVNKNDVPNDGIDNDNNGYVDDYYGWNALEENDNHSYSAQGLNHGTSVMGIIGAKGNNNLGITGVNWDIKMMGISGLPFESEIIEGYGYVLKMRSLYNETDGKEGAFVVATNLSLGIPNARAENFPIWCSMYELLGEQGIVSVGATANSPVDIDENGDMPTSCESNYLITVTSSDVEDNKVLTTAFGKNTIDLSAPGLEIYTCKPNNTYDIFSGTSAAAPFVTGTIGLLYASPCQKLSAQACSIPLETANVVKALILDGVDKNDELKSLTLSGGRLNVRKSLSLVDSYCQPVDGSFNFYLKQNPITSSESLRFNYISSDQENLTRINIYNSMGQLIFEKDLSPSLFGEKEEAINLSSKLVPGTYFIMAIDSRFRMKTEVLVVH